MPGLRMENGVAMEEEEGSGEKAVKPPSTFEHEAKAAATGPDHPMARTDPPPAEAVTNGDHVSTAMAAAGPVGDATLERRPPPKIDRIESQGYKDLGQLTVRLVQETLNELNDLIHALADMSDASGSATASGHHSMANGSGPAQVGAQKRLRLMNFVQQRRAQFIKILVLANWSRSTEEVRQAIDILQWLRAQDFYNEEAADELGRLKLSLAAAKLPNPNLPTALEVLSTGKASYPDLGYIPPKPLSPHEILKTLRNMNVLLSIRLNLHESLPPYFDQFTIASGRATFVVRHEFEVDLSMADTEPDSQLYFIDLRFLFPVDSDVLQGRLRTEIEDRANQALKTDGLAGCYHLLHELVLTHKINLFRKQAAELIRGRWAESVKLEMVHRTLVLQYWVKKAGAKSWIEIGIRRSVISERTAPDQPATSGIAIRWMREAREAKESPLTVPPSETSVEDVLKRVLALHVNDILRSVRRKLMEAPLYGDAVLSLTLTTSSRDPVRSKVTAQLTRSRTMTLSLEPVGGRFALEPASLRFSQVEHALNGVKDATTEAASHVANLRCLVSKEEIEKRARCVGWNVLRTLAPKQDELRRVFPRDTLQISYLSRPGWGARWVVALTVGMGGEDWWVLELIPAAVGHTIGDHQRVPMATATGRSVDATYEYLSRLETISVGMISLFVNERYLSQARVEHFFRPLPATADRAERLPMLVIRFSSLLAHGNRRRVQAWAKEGLVVRYHGIASSTGRATQMVEARLIQPKLFEKIQDRIDDDVAFHPRSGSFAFRLSGPVGEPMVAQMQDRLLRIERLIRFLQVLRRRNLECDSISLAGISFCYAVKPQLRVTIGFGGNAPMRLSMEAGNPHLRVLDFISRVLNDNGDDGLEHVAILLDLSLPLFRTIQELEGATMPAEEAEANSSAGAARSTTLLVLPRAADWLQLRYERPRAFFDIRLRQRRDAVKWYVSEDTASLASSGRDRLELRSARPAALGDGLRELMGQSGDGWIGLRTGIAATPEHGIVEALRKLDAVVRAHAPQSVLGATAGTAVGSTAGSAPATGGADKARPGQSSESALVLD